MVDSTIRSDLRIYSPSVSQEKVTLSLDATGEIGLLQSTGKLSAQLLRAIINENSVIRGAMNSPVAKRQLTALFTQVLRTFRQNQIDEVNRTDPDFSGFAFYRLKTGTSGTYTKISPNCITYSFTDTGLMNGKEYKYAVTKLSYGTFESDFTERLSITPQAASRAQEVVIGTDVVAIVGNQKVDFYVVYNQNFIGSELLENIVSLDVEADTTDPRRYVVNIVVQDLRGSQVSISAVQHKASV